MYEFERIHMGYIVTYLKLYPDAQQESGDNYIMRNFIISISHQILYW